MYRLLEDGEVFEYGDEYASDISDPCIIPDPNDSVWEWLRIPDSSIGCSYYKREYKPTRRKIVGVKEEREFNKSKWEVFYLPDEEESP